MENAPEVIALVTQKGGAGKSTILTNLAVNAVNDGHSVMVVDADPQQTLNTWWEDREADDIDCVLVGADEVSLIGTVKERFTNYDFVFIDTPAQAEALNRTVITASDFCLLPCRPSLPDMRAQRITSQTVIDNKKHGAFIVSQAPSQGTRGLETKKSLAIYGLPVAKPVVTQLVAYQDAYGLGLGVAEFEPEGKAADESIMLWKWLQQKMEKLK